MTTRQEQPDALEWAISECDAWVTYLQVKQRNLEGDDSEMGQKKRETSARSLTRWQERLQAFEAMKEIERLCTIIERLRAENESLRSQMALAHTVVPALCDEVERLSIDNESLRSQLAAAREALGEGGGDGD